MIHDGKEFVYIHCWKCKVSYFLPVHLFKSAKESENIWFHCPYGHIAHYPAGETDEDKLRRERDIARQQVARAEEDAKTAWKTANEQAGIAKRALADKARLKKRAAAGTCPCCQRTFSNMATHLRHKHPEFVAKNVVSLKAKSA